MTYLYCVCLLFYYVLYPFTHFMQPCCNCIVILLYSKFTFDHVHLLSDCTTFFVGWQHFSFCFVKKTFEGCLSFYTIFSSYTFHSYTSDSYTFHSSPFHSSTFDSYTFHSYTFHSYTFDSYTFDSYTFRPYTFHLYTFHSNTFHSYSIHLYTFHSYTIHLHSFHWYTFYLSEAATGSVL